MIKEDLVTRDKIIGCLVGGAVGDALGYAVEFEDYGSILRKYGRPGITRYELGPSGKALVSDDTQMTLFTAAGCLLGITRGACRGIMGPLYSYCEHTYRDWYFTQTHSFEQRSELEYPETWLMLIPELYHRRAPGSTCMSALRDNVNGVPHTNNSCGCGGVMRVAPIALLCERFGNGYMAADQAAMAARITHQHPLGFLPAAALALILCDILRCGYTNRAGLTKAVEHALEELPRTVREEDGYKTYAELWPDEVEKLSGLIRKAMRLVDEEIADVDAISQLGQGWTGHEALAIAIYCAMKHPDSFDRAIVSAVNHSGDSDSTGAICGNIIGALHGRKLIPSYYTERLELLDVIEDIANDLYTGCPIGEYIITETVDQYRWELKYERVSYWEPKERMEARIREQLKQNKL